jgi:hypothetical protein
MAPGPADQTDLRTFEATELAPLAAMRRVLAEVEAWRGTGRLAVVPSTL